ncbi:cytosolic carboxypeptidase-like protein 5 isoform X2 [Stegodyphus dumicola]|nr:cytosolic carboxypeptidase-like protein 5 isoform X2 [Stegodyphus dumicola]XP_035232814.1 cytosolic carboxypeptidase-like protein 5 isoform X2 [Stegodyphus dumicola]
MLHYLIGSKDSIANRLRNLFVFKLIPMLNPDGVLRGHYRADIQGLNLNRIYMIANFQQHPSIYAARTLLLHYHTSYSTPSGSTDIRKNYVKKSRSSQVNTNFRRIERNPPSFTSKRLPKDLLNQAKTSLRKHPLHACDTLTRNLNFFSSVPVMLPLVTKSQSTVWGPSGLGVDGNSPKKSKKLSTLRVTKAASLSVSMEDMKEGESSLDPCSECKLPDYPSKKINLESDSSCNCIEASDADDSSSFDCEMRLGEGDASKLLKDVPCLKPEESGIAYYFDLHGHASKRGCFIYGNYFPDVDKMVECMFLPKLMSINCPYFDFSACNFSAENMYSGSNSNIQSKEGSGRVSLYVLTGIIHSYTLECNYNTCRYNANQKRPKRSNDVPSQVFFTPEIYHQIGESLLVSILDASGHNPKSQISNSPFLSVQGVKEWLRQHAQSLRGRCTSGYVRKYVPLTRARSQEKVSTRSLAIGKSPPLSASSKKALQRESSSSTANLSSNASDTEGKIAVAGRVTRSRTIRGTASLLSSPVSRRPTTLQRRHTFAQDLTHKSFRKPITPKASPST